MLEDGERRGVAAEPSKRFSNRKSEPFACTNHLVSDMQKPSKLRLYKMFSVGIFARFVAFFQVWCLLGGVRRSAISSAAMRRRRTVLSSAEAGPSSWVREAFSSFARVTRWDLRR